MRAQAFLIPLSIALVLLSAACVSVTIYPPPTAEPFDMSRDVLRRSQADIRTIGQAIEEYAIDNNFYPRPRCDRESLNGMCPVATLTPVLSPPYIRVLPVRDGWGNPYLYRSFSNGSSYAILTLGSDGVVTNGDALDHFFSNIQAGKPQEAQSTHCFEDEMVFMNGQFVFFPSGTIEHCNAMRGAGGG